MNKVRVSKTPQTGLPLSVRSIGYRKTEKGWDEYYPPRPFAQIFWSTSGSGIFTFEKRKYTLHPNCSCLYYSTDSHRISCSSDTWECRWITLDGPLCDEIIKEFNISKVPRKTGPWPEDLFVQIATVLDDLTPQGELQASALAYQLLSMLSPSRKSIEPEKKAINDFMQTVQQQFADKDLSIASIAHNMAMHRSSLCRLFKKKTGVSPQQYLSSVRLRKSMDLLINSEMNISEIAYACGFEDPDYFIKKFKRTSGTTPLAFRRSIR